MADIKPGEKSWNDVIGDPQIGHVEEDFKEVYDFTRESICMSDPEVMYVTSITVDGENYTGRAIYANTYFGMVIEIQDPGALAGCDPKDLPFNLVRGDVKVTYDIEEACVKMNEGKATIILPFN